MPTSMLAFLTDLGSPSRLWDLARRGHAPAAPPRINTHVHLPPNFSAFTTVAQVADLARSQGVGILGATNYYDYSVYRDFAGQCRDRGIFPLLGLEILAMDEGLRQANVRINDPGNPGKFYVCGKAATRFEPMPAPAAAILATIRRNDSARMRLMVEKLAAVLEQRGLATGLNEDRVIDMIVRRHGCRREQVYLQERHVCQAFQEALFAAVPADRRLAVLTTLLGAASKARGPEDHVTIQNDIRTHLVKHGKPAYVEETFISFDDARRFVLGLGGMPCYAAVIDGMSPLSEFERDPRKMVADILARGIHFAELITVRNAAAAALEYARALRAAGLPVTAGTEHNTLDLIPLDPTCKDGPCPREIRDLCWEGACVIAAHQFLSLHGERGFVDEDGRPNSDYQTAEERIQAFAALGKAVIREFQDQSR